MEWFSRETSFKYFILNITKTIQKDQPEPERTILAWLQIQSYCTVAQSKKIVKNKYIKYLLCETILQPWQIHSENWMNFWRSAYNTEVTKWSNRVPDSGIHSREIQPANYHLFTCYAFLDFTMLNTSCMQHYSAWKWIEHPWIFLRQT